MAEDEQKNPPDDKSKKIKKVFKVPEVPANLYKNLLLILIAITAGFFGGWYGNRSQTTNSNTGSSKITRKIVQSEGTLINTIAENIDPSVVSINIISTTTNRDFMGFGGSQESKSAGTGVILSKDGYVITNRHVISKNATKITVTLSDGTKLSAKEIGRTNDSDPLDVAFLKLDNTKHIKLKPAVLGDSDAVKIGDRVVAVGNALGRFQNTVTSGIISGFGRDIQAYDGGGLETLQNLFQTDAAINSGNSGGPLVNTASQVIGINVATASAENISFAIPINDVKGLIEVVLEKGKLERPYLGIRYIPINADVAKQYNLPVDQGAYLPQGTLLRPTILKNSPAEKAGLQEKDIITEIDGKKIDEKYGIVSILGKKKVGDVISIKILRNDKKSTLKATLKTAPDTQK